VFSIDEWPQWFQWYPTVKKWILDETRLGIAEGQKSMTDSTATVTPMGFQHVREEVLKEVTKRIVDALAPEQVILFGSYAEGRATVDSDLDLLVVTERPLSRRERLLQTQGLFRDMPLPIQVITISQLEFEETRDVIGGIAYPAAKYGRVIYEKSARGDPRLRGRVAQQGGRRPCRRRDSRSG